jgi:hypothetical protein
MPEPHGAGHDFIGGVYVPKPNERAAGTIEAIDPFTGQGKWQFNYFSSPDGEALSIPGGLVSAGNSDGNFIAFDARPGQEIWHNRPGVAMCSAAVTHLLDGRQEVQPRSQLAVQPSHLQSFLLRVRRRVHPAIQRHQRRKPSAPDSSSTIRVPSVTCKTSIGCGKPRRPTRSCSIR